MIKFNKELEDSLPPVYADEKEKTPSFLGLNGDPVVFKNDQGLTLHGELGYHEGTWYLDGIREKSAAWNNEFVPIWELVDETSGKFYVSDYSEKLGA